MSLSKWCLIIPPSPWLISDRVEVPLGILYVASLLQVHAQDVCVLDLSGGVYEAGYELPEADVYGIGFVSPQYIYAKAILDRIHDECPSRPVIAGGPHATALPEWCLERGFDAVVCGEAELAITDIVRNGITERIYYRPSVEIDWLPFPAYDLIDMESYVSNVGVVGYMGECREINIMGTRGCTGRCAYCTKYKGPLRWRSIDDIMGEIEYLQQQYDVQRFFFVDDNLIIRKSWLTDLCEALKAAKVSWHCLGRADMVDDLTAQMMAQCGCTGIDFGIESGSQEMLTAIKKHATVERQEAGIVSAARAGLKVRAQMMVDLPGETEYDIDCSRRFIERNLDHVAKWGIHSFVPFPTCDIWQNPEAYGFSVDHQTDFSEYQTIGKPGAHTSERRAYLEAIASERNIYA
jgi:radical SAM superfamily enzyme YgiQ (UPF0313 family)